MSCGRMRYWKGSPRVGIAFFVIFVLLLRICLLKNLPENYERNKSDVVRTPRNGSARLQDEDLSSFFTNLKSMLKGKWGVRGYCNNILEFADWPVCGDNLDPSSVSIYSFGIADDYDFEASSGLGGFSVFAFDPTRNYPRSLAKNVKFFSCGLRGERNEEWSHHHYGDTVGELLTLTQIFQATNLRVTKKIILKMDCEGCEWEALSFLAGHPNILSRIIQINIEMHFTTALRVNNTAAISHMKIVYKLLLNHGFVPWYIFPQGGSRSDRSHLWKIIENGFPQNLCCFEIGFLRNPARRLVRKNLVSVKRVLPRPESRWKWGQVWGKNDIEYVKHSELSEDGRGLSVMKSLPLKQDTEGKRKESCFSSMAQV